MTGDGMGLGWKGCGQERLPEIKILASFRPLNESHLNERGHEKNVVLQLLTDDKVFSLSY